MQKSAFYRQPCGLLISCDFCTFAGMKREIYKSQKVFAGAKKPSMQRRCVGHDYTGRQMYMITMTTECRHPLLGTLAGRSDAPDDSADAPRVMLTELGQRVEACWNEIAIRYPQISLVALQMMPDHFHGILFVKERLSIPMGKVLLGFKQGCNKAYRQLYPAVQSVAVLQQPTVQQPTVHQPAYHDDRTHGLLFARGFNDKLLLHDGQLQRWLQYLYDNPRRLLMKREHPQYLCVRQGVDICGRPCSAVGNIELLNAPSRMRVRISRSITPELLEQEKARLLSAARNGAVLVSAAISPGEKQVMRAAFNEGLPLIILLENGLHPLQKPSGERFMACAQGRLLLLSPFPHHNERILITRSVCETLNGLAWDICQGVELPARSWRGT